MFPSSISYMGTQWQSVPLVFGAPKTSAEGLNSEQKMPESSLCPDYSHHCNPRNMVLEQPHSPGFFGDSCLDPGHKVGKNPAWNIAWCGRVGIYVTTEGVVIPCPSLHLRMPFPNVRLIDSPGEKGTEELFLSEKGRTENVRTSS